RGGNIDVALLAGNLKRSEGARPISGASLHVEQSVDAPAKLRVAAHGLLDEGAGGFTVAAPSSFEEETAQTQELRLGAIEHGLEGAARGVDIAVELGGVGVEPCGWRLPCRSV